MEKIEITKAEIDALNNYAEKNKAALISAIFTDVEEMLWAAIKAEDIKAEFGAASNVRTHLYAMRLCQTLEADLRKIERKYKE